MFIQSLISSFEDVITEACFLAISRTEEVQKEKLSSSLKDEIILQIKKEIIKKHFEVPFQKSKEKSDEKEVAKTSPKQKRKLVVVEDEKPSQTQTQHPPPPPQGEEIAFTANQEEFAMEAESLCNVSFKQVEKEKDEEEDSAHLLTLTPKISSQHENLKLFGEVCEPLPAFFWKQPKGFTNGYGELYCTTDLISSYDWIVVILMKNSSGKLEMIGSVPCAFFPVLVSKAILNGNEKFTESRSYFIRNLNQISGFEYAYELLKNNFNINVSKYYF